MNKKDPTLLIRENILGLAPYSTARDEYDGPLGVYLDANENPYDNGYNRYPDPYQRALKERISQIKGVPAENIFIGNGSDEPIDLAFRVFCDPGRDNAVAITPSYGMYRVAAATNDVELREVRLTEDFGLDVDELLAVADENTKLMFLCSPNNPSGNSFPAEQLKSLLRDFGGVVVVDEAYIDFSDSPGLLPELAGFPNLIILQTLSKAWGMAGLRLGLAFAQEELIRVFTRVKYPYNINGLTQRIVLKQLDTDIGPQILEIKEQRAWVMESLATCPLARKVYPSDANFVLVRVDDPRGIYQELIRNGVIVRDRSRIEGCEGCLRITIGTPQENRKILEILKTKEVKK